MPSTPIVVQKFGGTSLADIAKLRRVAERVVSTRSQGFDVVVVVSAMGSTTDELLSMARSLHTTPPRRELDVLVSSGERISMALLSMAIEELACAAVSLSGPQSGIRTDKNHFGARIEGVQPARVLRELASGRIVVVAGYQGEAPDGDVTTLGRGGSDTSAVALAAVLGALRCEIYSDVEGVFSADPRIVDGAQLLERVTYDEMVAFSYSGASVLDRRAVEHAAAHRVELHARPAFGAGAGTIIGPPIENGDGNGAGAVTGVAGHRQLVRLRLRDSAADDGLARELESAVGVSSIPFSALRAGSCRTLFFPADELPARQDLACDLERAFDREVEVDDGLGSVSVIGLGIGDCESRRNRTRQVTDRHRITVDAEHAVDHAYTLLIERTTVLPAIRSIHDAMVPQIADGGTVPASG
ncbi:MAG TPA: aspartate kinase [Thermoanaerobaculia bacterium]|nr:aspartate kinase [Thermoanaerobaculia bacterium]